MDFNKEIRSLVENTSNKILLNQGFLNILNNEDFLKIHPEIKQHKNVILKELNENLKNVDENLKKIEVFSFLYKMANEVLAEKSNKLIKLKNYVEKSKKDTNKIKNVQDYFYKEENQSPDEIIDKMSNQIIEIYGLLNNIVNDKSIDMKKFKTAVISVISLYYDTNKNNINNDFENAIFIFKDVGKEDFDDESVRKFYKENNSIVKIDKYIENVEKVINSIEIERDVKKEKVKRTGVNHGNIEY